MLFGFLAGTLVVLFSLVSLVVLINLVSPLACVPLLDYGFQGLARCWYTFVFVFFEICAACILNCPLPSNLPYNGITEKRQKHKKDNRLLSWRPSVFWVLFKIDQF